jgi:hypothetical protein
MASCRLLGLAALSGLLLAGFVAAPASAAARKEPPACAAVKFRPVPSGMTDGEQDAGLYKSRFGKIELRAAVQSGEPQDYYLVVNGQKLSPVAGNLPKTAENCAREKKMPTPAKAAGKSCTGQRFNAVIAHNGQQKVLMLYGLQDRQWAFCSAGTV